MRAVGLVMALLACPALSGAQPVAPVMERVTFDEAIARALAKNPTVAQAATAIVRAEGFLQQARAATRPIVNAGLATTVLDKGLGFNDQIVQPRTQTLLSANASVPSGWFGIGCGWMLPKTAPPPAS